MRGRAGNRNFCWEKGIFSGYNEKMTLDFRQVSSLLLRNKRLAALVGAGAVLAFILIWSFGGGFFFVQQEDWTPKGISLAAVGEIPPLHEAIKNNEALRAKVEDFSAKDEAFLFVNYRQVDEDIATILLLWAGVDLSQTGKTEEDVDRRVDAFLRKAHGLSSDDLLIGEPLLGKNPWIRWLGYFKSRLLIQAAGQRIYDGGASYDYRNDKIYVQGKLSEDFFEGFTAFVKQQREPKPYINNLLVFIDETKGLKNLDEEENKLITRLRGQ